MRLPRYQLEVGEHEPQVWTTIRKATFVGYLALVLVDDRGYRSGKSTDSLAGQNQVGTLDIINGEVKRERPRLANAVLERAPWIDNSLTAADLAPGAVGTS